VPPTISIQKLGGQLPELHTIAVAGGYLGAVLGVSMVIPQIVRTFRNRTLAGVSAVTWALTALSCLTWMLYGVRSGEVPQIPGNILIVTGAAVIVLAVPSAMSRSMRAIGLAGPAALLVGLATVLPPPVIGFVAFGIGLISAVPQTIRSLTRPQPQTSAVSVLTWVLRAASQISWLFYALVLHDITVTISATFILITSTVLILSESSRRAPTAVLEPIEQLRVANATN
jgi:uncharacterized protein with PQ loop repeat